MDWLRQLRFRLSRLLNLRTADEGLVEEIRSHIDIETQENIERGMSPEEARRAAGIKFGSVVVAREESREVWGFRLLETLWQDVRYGVRVLAKSPGFTVAAILTLALGIGANTAMFSVIRGVILRPLPYEEPNRLVRVYEGIEGRLNRFAVAPANFLDWKAQNQVFEDMAVYAWLYGIDVAGHGEPVRVPGIAASANMLSLLGVEMARGRSFLPGEDSPAATPTTVLSHRLASRLFGPEEDPIGRILSLDGEPTTVVGILPTEFRYYRSYYDPVVPEIWLANPFRRDPPTQRYIKRLQALARLEHGVTLEEARHGPNRPGSRPSLPGDQCPP
jgi:putative ABC transport system permease protein